MTTSATIPNTAASAKRKSTHSQHEPVDIRKLQALTNIAATTTPNANLPGFSNYSLSTQSANTPVPPARIRRLDLAHRADVIFNETVLANRDEPIASNQQLHSPLCPTSGFKQSNSTSPVSPTFLKAGDQPITRMGSITSRRPTKVGSTSGLSTSLVHGQFINSISSEPRTTAVQDTDHRPQTYQTKNKSLRIMQDLDIGDLSFGVTDSDMVLYHQLNGMKKRKRSLAAAAAASPQQFNEIQDEYDAQMLRQFEQLRHQRRTKGDPDAFTEDGLFDDGGDFDIQGRRELSGMVEDMDGLQNMKKRYRREVPLNEQQQPDQQPEQHFTQIRTPPPPPQPSMSVPPIEMPQVQVGAGTTLPSVQPQHHMSPAEEKPRQHSLEERKMYPSTRRSITGIEDGLQQNQTVTVPSSIQPLNDTEARASLSRAQSLKKLLSPGKTAGSIRSKLGSFRGKKDQNHNGDASSIYTTNTIHSETEHVVPTAPAHLIRKSIISGPILVPVSDGNANASNNHDEFDTGNEYLGQPLPDTDRMIPAGIENENIPHDFRGVENERDKLTDSAPLSQHRYQRSSIISAVPLNALDMGTVQGQARAETVPKINENQEPVAAADQDHHEANTGAESISSSKSFDSQEDEDQRFFYTPQATIPNLNSGNLLSDEPPRPAPLPPVNSASQGRPRSNTPSSSLKQIFIPALVSNPSLPQPGSAGSPTPPPAQSNSVGGTFANLLKRGGSQLSFKRNRSKMSQLQATATNTSNLSIETTGISNLNTNRSPTPSRLVMLANALSTTSLLPRQGTPSEQNLSEDTTNTTVPRQIHSVEDTLLADRDMNDFRVETPNDLSRRNLVLSRSGTAEDEDAETESAGIPHREETVTQTISVPTQMKSMFSAGRMLSQRKMSYVLEDPVAESIHSRSASNATTATANDDMFGFDNTPKDLTFTSFKRQSSIMMPSGFSGDKLRRDLKELHSANEEHSPVDSIKSHKSAISSSKNQTSTTAHHSRARSGSIASMKSSGSGKSLMSKKSKFPKTSPTTTHQGRERSDSVISNYKPRSPTLSPNYKRFSGMSQSELLFNNNDDSSPIKQSQGQSYNPYEDDITGGNPYEQEHLDDEDDNPYLTWQRSQYGHTQDDMDTIPRTAGGVDVLNDVIQEDQGAEDIEGDTDTGRRMGSITDDILNEGLYD